MQKLLSVAIPSFNSQDYAQEGFPDSSIGKESACNAGVPSSIPGWEDSQDKGKPTQSGILAWMIS